MPEVHCGKIPWYHSLLLPKIILLLFIINPNFPFCCIFVKFSCCHMHCFHQYSVMLFLRVSLSSVILYLHLSMSEYNCSNLSFVIFFSQLLQFLLRSNSSVYFVLFGGIVKSMLLFGNVQVLLAIMLSMLHNTCIWQDRNCPHCEYLPFFPINP